MKGGMKYVIRKTHPRIWTVWKYTDEECGYSYILIGEYPTREQCVAHLYQLSRGAGR